MDFRPEDVGLKIASALLMYKKEITVSDIRAIPFFTDADQVKGAVEYLMRTFDAKIHSKLVAKHPIVGVGRGD